MKKKFTFSIISLLYCSIFSTPIYKQFSLNNNNTINRWVETYEIAEYDNNKRLLTCTNVKDSETTFYKYDISGNIIYSFTLNSDLFSYEFDSNGELIIKWNPSESSYWYQDSKYRDLTGKTVSNSDLSLWTDDKLFQKFNSQGLLIYQKIINTGEYNTNNKYIEIFYEYDNENKLTKVNFSDDFFITCEYDNHNRILTATTKNCYYHHYEYDSSGNIIHYFVDSWESSHRINEIWLSYDSKGNLIKYNGFVSNKALSNYWQFKKLFIDSFKPSHTWQQVWYKYDQNNHLISEEDNIANKTIYEYDSEGKIIYKKSSKIKSYRDEIEMKIQESFFEYNYESNNETLKVIEYRQIQN